LVDFGENVRELGFFFRGEFGEDEGGVAESGTHGGVGAEAEAGEFVGF